MSAFEKFAAQHVLDMAAKAGVPVPAELAHVIAHLDAAGTYAARAWADRHPDDWDVGCCDSSVYRGPDTCTCWVPVFDLEQQTPRPPESAADISVQPAMCGDCAFRPGSPERAEEFSREGLLALPASGQPFFCHTGIRRPVEWRHPDGRVVAGDPADYQPAMVGSLPFQADGSPALLCAGWAAIAAHQPSTTDREDPA